MGKKLPKFGVMFITKEPLKNALADTRRGWIKDYQEERRVEVKADADNVLEYSYILFLLDILLFLVLTFGIISYII